MAMQNSGQDNRHGLTPGLALGVFAMCIAALIAGALLGGRYGVTTTATPLTSVANSRIAAPATQVSTRHRSVPTRTRAVATRVRPTSGLYIGGCQKQPLPKALPVVIDDRAGVWSLPSIDDPATVLLGNYREVARAHVIAMVQCPDGGVWFRIRASVISNEACTMGEPVTVIGYVSITSTELSLDSGGIQGYVSSLSS
jgi:hypothetical protein